MTSPPPATIETLYSQGPIQSLPDIGPQRPDRPFEEYKAEVLGKKTAPSPVDKFEESTLTEISDPSYRYGSLIAFLVIAIVVIVIILIMATDFYRKLREDTNPPKTKYHPLNQKSKYQPPNQGLIYFLFVAATLLLAGVSYRLNLINLCQKNYRYTLIFIYVLVLVTTIIWAFLFFENNDSKSAFVTAIILGLIIIGWIWLIWSVDRSLAAVLLLYLAFTGYLAWISAERFGKDQRKEDQQ